MVYVFLKIIFDFDGVASNECDTVGLCKTQEHKNTTKLKLFAKLSTKWC